MGSLMYQIFTSSTLISLSLYHLISTTFNYLKSPQSYSAKPFHPLPLSPRFRHLQLHLIIFFLLISFAHQTLISSYSDPLIKGSTPVHLFTSLQSSALLLLFLLLSTSLLISESTSLLPLPPDLFFALASGLFFLQYSVSSGAASVQTSDLQAKCDMGLWVLQTGLTLCVDAFIPEGCHRLLDVVSGVEGSTQCDLEESRLRAVAILDLMFVVHVTIVVVVVMVVYAVMVKSIGIRRLGSYEALPVAAASADSNHNLIQMKALAGTQE
ncbi:hypothetical protein M5689_021199 [Euphorbia peplus]|nr:hypothetical protein M5689_021199 [Euphorbia peplus]